MDRFTTLKNKLKEIVLASKLTTQPFVYKDKAPIPQEPEK